MSTNLRTYDVCTFRPYKRSVKQCRVTVDVRDHAPLSEAAADIAANAVSLVLRPGEQVEVRPVA